MKYIPWLIMLLFTGAAILLFNTNAQAQTPANTYVCTLANGKQMYRGPDDRVAQAYCNLFVVRGSVPSATFTMLYQEGGVEKRKDVRYFAGWGQGLWQWEAPTRLENGNILTDLSHYLIYRQAPGGQPTVYAQVDGKATRFLLPMDQAHFGACFWTVAVRKPATSPAVASDKSNAICLDPAGLPLPAA